VAGVRQQLAELRDTMLPHVETADGRDPRWDHSQ
jgi:hypothetical protein